jgi:hypothetical protein
MLIGKALFKRSNTELFIWIAALIMLAFLNPDAGEVSLCPFKFLGFHYCPGCGLGRSIALLFRGRFSDSFSMHPLGFFAVAVIGYRIVQMAISAFNRQLNEGYIPEKLTEEDI